MTLEEAIAQQPAWLQYWLTWLVFGAFFLPMALVFWRQSRIAGIAAAAASLAAGLVVNGMYAQMGYVKLLGLPHIIIWTPLAVYLFVRFRDPQMPPWPRRIIAVVLATLAVSLAFDYVDVVRYMLGERTPLAQPPA